MAPTCSPPSQARGANMASRQDRRFVRDPIVIPAACPDEGGGSGIDVHVRRDSTGDGSRLFGRDDGVVAGVVVPHPTRHSRGRGNPSLGEVASDVPLIPDQVRDEPGFRRGRLCAWRWTTVFVGRPFPPVSPAEAGIHVSRLPDPYQIPRSAGTGHATPDSPSR